MMTRVRCIAFDFDGVLVDSNAIKRRAFYEVFAVRGVPTEVVTRCLERQAAGDRRDIIACIIAHDGQRNATPASLIDTCVRQYSLLCEQQIVACPERPGASDVLRRLAALAPLYVNSATPQDALRAVISRRGWSHHFREILGRPATKVDNLQRVLRVEGVEAPELLFVGDRHTDRVAAMSVGCQFLGIESDESDFEQSVQLIGALADLLDIALSDREQ